MKPDERSRLLEQAPRCRVAVVGDVMVDAYSWGRVDRISPEAPVPVVQITTETSSPGGAANVAVCVAALGAHAELFGTLGSDTRADELELLLSEASVTSRCVRAATEPTITKQRIWSGAQQLLRLDTEVAPPPDVSVERLSGAFHADGFNAVLVSDYGKGVIDADSMAFILDLGGRAGVPVVVDPKSDDFSRYVGCTIIKPNEREAREAYRTRFGRDGSIADIGSYLVAEVATAAIVTRGSEGIEVFTPDGHVHVPVHRQNVYDVTGAGDVVAAVVAVGAGLGWSLTESSRLANVAARISVSRVGTGGVSAAELLSDPDDTE